MKKSQILIIVLSIIFSKHIFCAQEKTFKTAAQLTKPEAYKILDISKDSDMTEIKKIFRKLAMKWHPDRNPNNEEAKEKFKQINAAYEFLEKSLQPSHTSNSSSETNSSEQQPDYYENTSTKQNTKWEPEIGGKLHIDLSIQFSTNGDYEKFINIEKIFIPKGSIIAKDGIRRKVIYHLNELVSSKDICNCTVLFFKRLQLYGIRNESRIKWL